MRLFSALVGLFFCIVAILVCTTAVAVDRTWDDGDPNNSFWDSNANWSDDTQPAAADKAIVGGNPEVNTLEIFGELENSGTIDITAGTLQPQGNATNNGTINLGNGSAIRSQLNISNSMTLSGSGEVVLQNSDNLPGSNAILTGGFSVAAVHDVGHTIRGEGSIIQHWQNDGVIRAEETTGDSSAVLRLDNTTFLNNGELRSASGATIHFQSAAYSQGVSGQLIADTDNITLAGVSSITGGSLETIGGGVFDTNGLITLSGVTVNAPIDNTNTSGPLNDGRLFVDSGGITNNSTITLEGVGGRNSQFGFNDVSGTVGGTGEIVLLGGNINTFIGVFPGFPREFTQGASHTIRGAGRINSPMINNGTIRAEPGTDGSILLVNGFHTNNGLMEAGSGATLEFQSGTSDTVQGANGIISAANGGAVEFENTEITGGRLETAGTGTMTVTATSIFNSVTNAGNLDVPSSRRIDVGGGSLTNNGTITVNSDGGAGVPRIQAIQDTLLSGSGEVFLDGTNNSFRSDIVPNGFTITHDPNHTVRGNGQILGIGTFVNNGRIEGNSAADPMRIRTRLEGTGTLSDVNLNFDSSGTVHAPGSSAGTVPLEGSYAITHNLVRLEIEIGGLTAGTEHDLLDGSGDPNSSVSLNGILDVLALDTGTYTPTAGDRFMIIQSANAISGTFASVNFPDVLGGRFVTWDPVDYTTDPNAVSLEIATVNFFDADFDMDGDVDNDDLSIWDLAYATNANGDANGDGRSDGLDFLIWQEQFGLGVPTPLVAAMSAVPEPSTLLLMGLGCLMGFRHRR